MEFEMINAINVLEMKYMYLMKVYKNRNIHNDKALLKFAKISRTQIKVEILTRSWKLFFKVKTPLQMYSRG